MHWDHRDWVHHRGVVWGCHGWVGIVRWHGWVEIASVVIWMSSLLFSCILCFYGPSPKRLKAKWANFSFKPKWTGARFSKGPKNFLGLKANFKIRICWIVAQFLAHKPVNLASLTDSFIISFQNYWNLDLECKHETFLGPKLFGAEKLLRLLRNRPLVCCLLIHVKHQSYQNNYRGLRIKINDKNFELGTK